MTPLMCRMARQVEYSAFLVILHRMLLNGFTCDHVWNWNKIISAAERVLRLFQNYLSDIRHAGKYSWAAISLWNRFEIISVRQVSTRWDKIISDGRGRRLKQFYFICNHGITDVRYWPSIRTVCGYSTWNKKDYDSSNLKRHINNDN